MMEVEQGGSAKTQTTSDLVSPLAGRKVPPGSLINVSRLLTDYFTLTPEPQVPAQRVIFGTSGHRGSAHDRSFNEGHVLAITQAICDDRQQRKIDGPLFLGIDTHALSESARASVLQVLAANGVLVQLAGEGQYTPTPAISLAIVTHNRGRQSRLADGIVLTPSHNSPRDGGFKYNPPHGGPAGQEVTGRIESVANQYLDRGLVGVRRISVARALTASTTARYDFMSAYVEDLSNVIDLELLRAAQVRMAVDPMGGAGVHYWPAIAERLRLDITVLNPSVDPTFSFMRLDWDGKIRMDPSSAYVMQALVERRAAFDVLFACDTDHDRHGIVCESMGLFSSNQYLPLAIDYLLRTRTQWSPHTAVGKSVVSTALIDAVVKGLGR